MCENIEFVCMSIVAGYVNMNASVPQSGEEGSPHSKKRHYEPPEDSEEDKHLGLVARIHTHTHTHTLTQLHIHVHVHVQCTCI